MVRFNLEVIAELENIEELYLDSGPESRIYLQLKCTECGAIQGGSEKSVYISGELYPTSKGQEANYVAKCRDCKKQMTLSIVQGSYKAYVPNPDEDSNPEYCAVLQVEARGVEPINVDDNFLSGWAVKSVCGEVFENIDLEEIGDEDDGRDWVDIEEDTKTVVGVNGFKTRFVKVHGS